MKILGIDTSCDDTSASIVSEGGEVLSNVIHSQVKLHHPYGGVVPELASREHVRNIVPVVHEALAKARLNLNELDGLAVTIGPGLIGSLLVGLYYGKALAYVNQIPLAGINHLEGHILSIFLEEDVPPFPFMALTVSGGHTSITLVNHYGDYTLLGQSLDDAAGEAFDKVAKLLGLGYPGGPVIEEMARGGKGERIHFPRATMGRDSLDFSFSGIKTAVALYVKRWRDSSGDDPGVRIEDIAASFQEAVMDVLIQKLILAGKRHGVHALVLAGGVACNRTLRGRLRDEASEHDMSVYWPQPEYCTDNGAMIALAGYHRLTCGERADMDTDVRSRFPIDALPSLSHAQASRE